MWKKLGFVLAFLGLMFVVDRSLSAALGRLVMASNLRLATLYDGRVDADVVIVGNSRGVHLASAAAWSRTICRSVYNLSLNGLDTATQDVLVRDYLERNRPPEIAVIEISNVFEHIPMAGELKPFLGDSPRLDALVREQQGAIVPWTRISHLYRFNSEYLLRALLFLFRPSDQDPEPGGAITPAIIETYLGHHPRFAAHADNVRILAATLEALRERGVKPVLVLGPYHPAAFREVDWREEALASVKALLPRDVAIVDWSSALSEDAAFSDPLHMSAQGREDLVATLAASPLARAASLCPVAVGSGGTQGPDPRDRVTASAAAKVAPQ